MCEKNGAEFNKDSQPPQFSTEFQLNMNHSDLKNALRKNIVDLVDVGNQFLSETQPWTKTDGEQQEILQTAVSNILLIAKHLEPFMPNTAKTISAHFANKKITAFKPLFPRLSE